MGSGSEWTMGSSGQEGDSESGLGGGGGGGREGGKISDGAEWEAGMVMWFLY